MFKALEKFVRTLFKSKDLLKPYKWYKVEFWIYKMDNKSGYVNDFKITLGVEEHPELNQTQFLGHFNAK
jgi:hypothetical protein